VRRWQQKQSAEIFRNPRVVVFEDDVVQPDGSEGKYTVIEIGNAVFILAVTDDGRIVVVRQHRYPIDQVTVEVPAGQYPAGSDVTMHALRELKEETGITAGTSSLLGEFVAAPSRIRRRSQVVLVTNLDLKNLTTNGQEGDEAIESAELVTQENLAKMIANGELIDANTITALTLYWSKYGFPKQ
jgi:8-oxo-dGTP pyrophosphatase MutT (NUDIX family)